MNNPWENYFGAFSPNDGTVDFYTRVGCFLRPEFEVLDLGAGRAGWYGDDDNACRKSIRLIKGRVRKVVAADLDSAVLENRAADECILIKEKSKLPFNDSSFDVVIADFVLEHIEDPIAFSTEVNRILRPGGLFAARTPHKYCYVAMVARLIQNTKHATFLKYIQPHRKELDVFPTNYRMNRLSDVAACFPGYNSQSFVFRSDPAYFFGSSLLFKLQEFLHRVAPAFFSGCLFIFLLKNPPPGRAPHL